jgi:hypothetical protein
MLNGRGHELASRSGDGLEVSLYWSEANGTVTLVVVDQRTEVESEHEVPRERALEAFYHPFAFLPVAA